MWKESFLLMVIRVAHVDWNSVGERCDHSNVQVSAAHLCSVDDMLLPVRGGERSLRNPSTPDGQWYLHFPDASHLLCIQHVRFTLYAIKHYRQRPILIDKGSS